MSAVESHGAPAAPAPVAPGLLFTQEGTMRFWSLKTVIEQPYMSAGVSKLT
jgi:hypothetical protein